MRARWLAATALLIACGDDSKPNNDDVDAAATDAGGTQQDSGGSQADAEAGVATDAGGTPGETTCSAVEVQCNSACLKSTGSEGAGCKLIDLLETPQGLQLSGQTLVYADGVSVRSYSVATGKASTLRSDLSVPKQPVLAGDKIYFAAQPPEGGTSWNLYSMPLAGGEPTLIADTLDSVGQLQLASSDLLFYSTAIFKVPVAGGEPSQVYGPGVNAEFLVDGDSLFVTTNGNGVLRLSLQTPATMQTLATGTSRTLRLAQDATNLYWGEAVNGANLGVRRLAKQGGQVATVHDFDASGELLGIQGSNAYVTQNKTDHTRIFRVPVAGGAPQLVAVLEAKAHVATAIAPDALYVLIKGPSSPDGLLRIALP